MKFKGTKNVSGQVRFFLETKQNIQVSAPASSNPTPPVENTPTVINIDENVLFISGSALAPIEGTLGDSFDQYIVGSQSVAGQSNAVVFNVLNDLSFGWRGRTTTTSGQLSLVSIAYDTNQNLIKLVGRIGTAEAGIIVSVDKNGNLLNTVRVTNGVDSITQSRFEAIRLHPSGDWIVGGRLTRSVAPTAAAFIMRITSNNSIVWGRNITNNSSLGIKNLVIDDNTGDIFGFIGLNSSTMNVLKFNSSGVLQWQRNLGTFTNTGSVIEAVIKNNHIYVIIDEFSVNGANVVKIDFNGQVVWARRRATTQPSSTTKATNIDVSTSGVVTIIGNNNATNLLGVYFAQFNDNGDFLTQRVLKTTAPLGTSVRNKTLISLDRKQQLFCLRTRQTPGPNLLTLANFNVSAFPVNTLLGALEVSAPPNTQINNQAYSLTSANASPANATQNITLVSATITYTLTI